MHTARAERWSTYCALLALLLGSCQRTDATGVDDAAAWSVVVDGAWLARHRTEVRILDARPATDYAIAHIPGAVNLPRGATYDPTPGRADMLAPLHVIEGLLGAAGITGDSTVIVYDDADYRDAARVLWVLEVHGLEHVAVLDGGLSGWRHDGGEVTGTPTIPAPVTFVAELEPGRLATKATVLRTIGDRTGDVVVDSRSLPEYVGDKSRYARAGHIPAASHLDFADLLAERDGACHLRSIAELRQAVTRLPAARHYVMYCNTGTRAAVGYLALRMLGRDASLYDGSWREWSQDQRLPIALGADPTPPR